MKKYILFLALIFLTACDSSQTDLALKEKCSKFVQQAQHKIESEAENESIDFSITTYGGTYYSRELDTCVTIKKVFYYPTDVERAGRARFYFDELTGQDLGLKYEEYSDSTKDSFYLDYEDSLELVK